MFLSAIRRLVCVTLILLVAGCGEPVPPNEGVSAATEARRIVTLSPHLAELVYAAGAGSFLVGVSEYTDFPAEAKQLPRVGDAFRVDYEQLSRMDPDLVLAWPSGNPPGIIARIRALGFRVVELEPGSLDDIGMQIALIGDLAGTRQVAEVQAQQYRGRLRVLRSMYDNASNMTVFYQLSANPFYTVNGSHVISEIISLCGGSNIFAELEGLAPAISLEAIIAANPQVIIAPQNSRVQQSRTSSWQEDWRRWPSISAVRDDHLYSVDWDSVSRSGPRILDAVEEICSALNAAREPVVGNPATGQ